jgi:hypothetical protein
MLSRERSNWGSFVTQMMEEEEEEDIQTLASSSVKSRGTLWHR